MDKLRLLMVCITFCYFSTKFLTESKTCWKHPYCTCSSANRTSIYCSRVYNISDVFGLFKSRSPIYKIRLRGNFTTIPSKAFNSISVSVLWLAAPLQFDIPEDSLSGIQDLEILILNLTVYNKIPEVFSNQLYTVFESSRGRLMTIETELQNMSSATEIRLGKNQLNFISPDAFHGTNNIRRLDLSYNELVYLNPKILESLTFLEAIYLQHNRLQMLDGCFYKLNPKVIDLYGNNLTNINHVLHNGMWNLKILNIGGNPDLELTNHTFNSSFKSLSELHLSNNEYTELDPNLLKKLFKLQELYLNGNNLVYIHRYFFENNPFLKVLELSNNRLTTVEEALSYRRNWYNWVRISLDGNELKSISLGKKPAKINSLDLSRNQIRYIQDEDMVVLQKVSYLNLSFNDLTSLEKNTFTNFHFLKMLDLSNNYLKHLNYSLQGLSGVTKLYLSSMSLEHLSEDDFLGMDRLKLLNLSNNSLETVSGTFRHLQYLSYLDVAMNNLTTLTTDSFPSFWNASMRLKVLVMAGNPWTCDCRLAWMASWIRKKGSTLKDEPVCAAPDHFKGLPLRSLNLTDYLRWYDDCPDMCECTCHWDKYQVYTEARCIQLGLKEIPKVFPDNLRTLDLSWNNIESFDSREVCGFTNLDQLNLEHNSINKIQINGLPSKMSSLQLAYNQLHTFPLDEWMTINASMNQISLSHNPWDCGCDAWSFRNWIIQEKKIIVDAQEIRCNKEESFYLRNKLIISLTQKQLCSFLSSIITLSICSALLLLFVLLIFCYRHSLIALFYASGCGCLKSTGGHEYPYDIFLMYCEEDEQLALGELATGLENTKYSFNLCIPDRDISAPRTQQKINSYLPLCSKVLVLLSKSFIENRDCIRFLVSAMSFSTENSAKCIIFIIKGDLGHQREMDPILRTLLRSCTCLKWGECLFWQRLVYQLPKKGEKKQPWGDAEEEVH